MFVVLYEVTSALSSTEVFHQLKSLPVDAPGPHTLKFLISSLLPQDKRKITEMVTVYWDAVSTSPGATYSVDATAWVSGRTGACRCSPIETPPSEELTVFCTVCAALLSTVVMPCSCTILCTEVAAQRACPLRQSKGDSNNYILFI